MWDLGPNRRLSLSEFDLKFLASPAIELLIENIGLGEGIHQGDWQHRPQMTSTLAERSGSLGRNIYFGRKGLHWDISTGTNLSETRYAFFKFFDNSNKRYRGKEFQDCIEILLRWLSIINVAASKRCRREMDDLIIRDNQSSFPQII